jgi:hypothetical protein
VKGNAMSESTERKVYVAPVLESLSVTETSDTIGVGVGVGVGDGVGLGS